MRNSFFIAALMLACTNGYASNKCEDAAGQAALSVFPASYECFLFATGPLPAKAPKEAYRVYLRCPSSGTRDHQARVTFLVRPDGSCRLLSKSGK